MRPIHTTFSLSLIPLWTGTENSVTWPPRLPELSLSLVYETWLLTWETMTQMCHLAGLATFFFINSEYFLWTTLMALFTLHLNLGLCFSWEWALFHIWSGKYPVGVQQIFFRINKIVCKNSLRSTSTDSAIPKYWKWVCMSIMLWLHTPMFASDNSSCANSRRSYQRTWTPPGGGVYRLAPQMT